MCFLYDFVTFTCFNELINKGMKVVMFEYLTSDRNSKVDVAVFFLNPVIVGMNFDVGEGDFASSIGSDALLDFCIIFTLPKEYHCLVFAVI